jgi:hypothetical protein
MGQLTPVMLIATDGLLQNEGISINANLVNALSSYNATNVVSSFNGVVANTLIAGTANVISNATILSLQTVSSNNLPAITNAIPSQFANVLGASYPTGFSGYIGNLAFTESGNGDVSKFVQGYNMAQGYRFSTNEFVNTVQNVNILDSTFINMNALTTAGITEVTTDTQLLGYDLLKLGSMINLANIEYFGYPWALLYQLVSTGGLLPSIELALTSEGAPIAEVLANVGTGYGLASNLDSKVYKAMTKITGDDLEQVKALLNVYTAGLTTMADMLNPVKVFPNSYQTLVTRIPSTNQTPPNNTVQIPVYVNGSANPVLQGLFEKSPVYLNLVKIVPVNQALGCQGFVRSLKQIKNILYTNLQDLALSTLATETNNDLPLINSLTQPVPNSVSTNLSVQLSGGTGQNGTITLYDVIGTVTGYVTVTDLPNATNTINSMQSANAFGALVSSSGLFPQMNETLAGGYGDPVTGPIVIPSGPAAGTYTDANDAFNTGLIPATSTVIGNIVVGYATQTVSLNSNFSNIGNQISNEYTNQQAAEIKWNDLQANSRTSTLSFASTLHDIGIDITPGGPAEFIAQVANTSTQTGQAIIASMREGRNIQLLSTAGIGSDAQVSSAYLGNIAQT